MLKIERYWDADENKYKLAILLNGLCIRCKRAEAAIEDHFENSTCPLINLLKSLNEGIDLNVESCGLFVKNT